MNYLKIPYKEHQIKDLIKTIKFTRNLSYIEMAIERIDFFDSNCELISSCENFLRDKPKGEQVEVSYLLGYLLNLFNAIKEQERLIGLINENMAFYERITNNSIEVCAAHLLTEVKA